MQTPRLVVFCAAALGADAFRPRARRWRRPWWRPMRRSNPAGHSRWRFILSTSPIGTPIGLIRARACRRQSPGRSRPAGRPGTYDGRRQKSSSSIRPMKSSAAGTTAICFCRLRSTPRPPISRRATGHRGPGVAVQLAHVPRCLQAGARACASLTLSRFHRRSCLKSGVGEQDSQPSSRTFPPPIRAGR